LFRVDRIEIVERYLCRDDVESIDRDAQVSTVGPKHEVAGQRELLAVRLHETPLNAMLTPFGIASVASVRKSRIIASAFVLA
jgi:hypothetical protein